MSHFKFLHTADWHLGKLLYKKNREKEHLYFLQWLYETIVRDKINLLIIAGDLFDSVNPGYQTQKILYDFIYKLGKIPNFQTIIIAGNHDSSKLFEIPKSFFKEHNCSIYSTFDSDHSKLEHYIHFQEQKIGIKLLPYFRNFELINQLAVLETPKFDSLQILETFFKNFFSKWKRTDITTKILIAHHCFGKYHAVGSEHAIFLSGIESFPLEWVTENFAYTALGHIHKKQILSSSPYVVYPGSPLPLRFSESNHKYLSKVTLNEKNEIIQENILIPQSVLLKQVECTLLTYHNDINHLISNHTEDKSIYLEVIMKLDEAKSGIVDEIKEMLKATPIELISYLPFINSSDNKKQNYQKIKDLSLVELFEHYYQHKFNSTNIPDDILKSFKELLEEIRSENP